MPEIEAAVASALRALTGFDRAMVYRFHEDEHGEIVAEDRLPGLVRYLGHHFPANDLPPQARQIYTRKPSRYIPDVDEGDVAVIASPSMAGTSLDLSRAALRSVSPFHLEYMRNMKTAASVSFAMADEGRLTRLVSCISEKPQWLSRSTRRSCELVVLQAKLQLSAAERIARLSDSARADHCRGGAVERRRGGRYGTGSRYRPSHARFCAASALVPWRPRAAVAARLGPECLPRLLLDGAGRTKSQFASCRGSSASADVRPSPVRVVSQMRNAPSPV
ncbi:GAF domain-containing protein [Mycobacterium sp.]|uniref:GAF domain-containing protein n=1 Tax=Mycobacterium sp. TaxID=1785 RepID=UPI003C7070F7